MVQLTQTTQPLKAKDIDRAWHLIDLKDEVLGRGATRISELLIGKHKHTYTPHMDNGDHVVVINARRVQVTGKKESDKIYTRYSGYPSGLRELTFTQLMDKDPRKVVENAVSGMLPKNKLRNDRMARLHVFADDKHTFSDKLTA